MPTKLFAEAADELALALALDALALALSLAALALALALDALALPDAEAAELDELPPHAARPRHTTDKHATANNAAIFLLIPIFTSISFGRSPSRASYTPKLKHTSSMQKPTATYHSVPQINRSVTVMEESAIP